MAVHLTSNPNIDVIAGISPLVKDLIKMTGIKIKRIRKVSPKLAAYYENRCDASREGIHEVIKTVRAYADSVDEKAEGIISQLKRIAISDVAYDEVVSVEKEFGEPWVYDLCVEKTIISSLIISSLIIVMSPMPYVGF